MAETFKYTEMTAAQVIAEYAQGRRDFTWIELPEEDSFKNATLVGIIFDHSWLPGVDFRNSDLGGASVRYAHVKLCNFDGANLLNADFRRSGIDGATFRQTRIAGAKFAGATVYGAELKDSDLPK